MSRAIVLKSFAELAEVLQLDDLPDGPAHQAVETPALPAPAPDSAPDLANLLVELEAASARLATILRQDQETRSRALRDLEQYDALVAQQCEAEAARQQAERLRREAEALAAGAFADEARAAVERVAEQAARAEAAAASLVEQRRADIERLSAELDVERLLAERHRQEEAEKERAAEAERARRLSEALARARTALEAGRLQEAEAVLGPALTENPDNAEIASLLSMIHQRALAVKVAAAEEALWAARRVYRQTPGEAVALLAGLDVDGLPDDLARQVFGEWARACARWCRERGHEAPLRYAPDPGRGAVLVRDGEGYVVLSAVGMDATWRAGSAVPAGAVRRARSLR